jgi:hypothetical protein
MKHSQRIKLLMFRNEFSSAIMLKFQEFSTFEIFHSACPGIVKEIPQIKDHPGRIPEVFLVFYFMYIINVIACFQLLTVNFLDVVFFFQFSS